MKVETAVIPAQLREQIFACQTEDDWDDDGAVGITRASCEAALSFLQEVVSLSPEIPMPTITPSVFGSITLHWRHGVHHLIVRPAADGASAYYRFEEQHHISYGDEPQSDVQCRVVRFFGAGNAEEN